MTSSSQDMVRTVNSANQSVESVGIIVRVLQGQFQRIGQNISVSNNEAEQLLRLIDKTNRQIEELGQTLQYLQISIQSVKQIEQFAV